MNRAKFETELNAISGGKTNLQTPQFMGMQKGNLDNEQVRAMIKRQKRVKGFRFSIPTGSSTFDIQLSGTARLLLGFLWLPPDFTDPTGTPESHTWNVNNEIVIDQVRPFLMTNYSMDDEYYFIPRPLSGTDEIKVNFQNSGAAQTWDLAVYYI